SAPPLSSPRTTPSLWLTKITSAVPPPLSPITGRTVRQRLPPSVVTSSELRSPTRKAAPACTASICSRYPESGGVPPWQVRRAAGHGVCTVQERPPSVDRPTDF